MNQMSLTLTAEMRLVSLALQQLKPAAGPTPLVVMYVQLKSLLLALLAANPDQWPLSQAAEQLKQISQDEIPAMLDCYQRQQYQAYQDAFSRIQRRLKDAFGELSA